MGGESFESRQKCNFKVSEDVWMLGERRRVECGAFILTILRQEVCRSSAVGGRGENRRIGVEIVYLTVWE
jgi:hypothetical protein